MADRRAGSRPATPACRSWPSATSGCTSRAWAPTTTTCRSSSAARAATSGTSTASATSTASPRCSASTPATAHGARRGGGGPDRGARLLRHLELRASARDRARRPDRLARAGRPQPGLLHLRRLRGRRVRAEARSQLPPATRQGPAAQGDRPRDRLPRHDAGALSRDGHPSAEERRSSRWCRAGATCPTPTATAGRRTATRSGRPTGSRSGSTSRARDGRRGDPRAGAERGRLHPPPDGYFQRVREICDRHDVLLISDEVICTWGRLGHYFGCERYGYQPGHHHDGEGADLRLRPDGGDDRLRPGLMEPFARGQGDVRPRLHLRRASRWPPRRDGQPRHLRARGPLRPRPAKEGEFRERARDAARHPDRRRRARRGLLPWRSSWSRTRRPRPRSPTRSPRTCCAVPLRRALPPRPDLPRRRPRRPGDPARAAADRRHASSSRRSRTCCALCSTGVPTEAWDRASSRPVCSRSRA